MISHIPRRITLPKTVASRATVEQFHRLCLNWYWHSSTPSFAPFPTLTITSGFSWHNCRWMLTSPVMVSHMTLAPRAKTWDMNLPNKTAKNWTTIREKCSKVVRKSRAFDCQLLTSDQKKWSSTYHQWDEVCKGSPKTKSVTSHRDSLFLNVTILSDNSRRR